MSADEYRKGVAAFGDWPSAQYERADCLHGVLHESDGGAYDDFVEVGARLQVAAERADAVAPALASKTLEAFHDDPVEAFKWRLLAERNGEKMASDNMAAMPRSGFGAEQVREAQARADAFERRHQA